MGQPPREERRQIIEKSSAGLSLRRQCELLNISRSSIYEIKSRENDDLRLLNEVRDIWGRYPFYGYRRITKELRFKGHLVNRKRVQRLMLLGGIGYLSRT